MPKTARPFRKFEPLISALKDKFTLFCILMVILFLADLLTGSPVISYIVRLQFNLKGVDAERQAYVLTSFFGRFDSVLTMARTVDRAGAIFFGVISGFMIVRGFLSSLFNEPPQ
jgi:hypothetical protein